MFADIRPSSGHLVERKIVPSFAGYGETFRTNSNITKEPFSLFMQRTINKLTTTPFLQLHHSLWTVESYSISSHAHKLFGSLYCWIVLYLRTPILRWILHVKWIVPINLPYFFMYRKYLINSTLDWLVAKLHCTIASDAQHRPKSDVNWNQ